jgi:hypothetical protein
VKKGMMVLQHILAMLCEMFSVTPIMTDGKVEVDPSMALTLTRFESSGFLRVEAPKNACECSSH